MYYILCALTMPVVLLLVQNYNMKIKIVSFTGKRLENQIVTEKNYQPDRNM